MCIRDSDHAELYLKIGVGTPQPVGYFNVRSGLLFDKSYYVSCLSTCPYVYNDLFRRKFDYEEEVLREIGRVTAVLDVYKRQKPYRIEICPAAISEIILGMKNGLNLGPFSLWRA